MLALLTGFGSIDPPEGGGTGRGSERVGCPGATNSGNLYHSFFFSKEVGGGERKTYGGENGYVW